MASKGEIQQIMAQYGLSPNRGLGQNFLVDQAVIEQIVEASQVEGKTVLEIGPGLGALTGALMKRAGRVIAVEKDRTLAALLPSLLPSPALEVVAGDFLDADVPALLGETSAFAAVGNLPYYVTTPISLKLLTCLPETATLMVQREAAERFVALPGNRVYGPLSVLAACCYDVQRLLSVGPEGFWPQPKVESAVLLLKRKPRADSRAAAFVAFLNRAFAMRRKTLANNFRSDGGVDAPLRLLGLDPSVRAEALSPDQLLAVFSAMEGEDKQRPLSIFHSMDEPE